MSDKLLLARLFTAGERGLTEARLLKEIVPIFARAVGAARATEQVVFNLSRAVEEQLVLRSVVRSRAQLQLSDAGMQQAQALFPGAAPGSWATLRKTWLIAHALGIERSVTPASVRALSKLSSLRMVVIAQHFELDVPLPPQANVFERALIWYALQQGLSDPVRDWAKRRDPTLGLIVAAVTASAGGVAPSVKKAEVFARLAAKLAGARNAAELHAALLSRLVATPEDGRGSSNRATPDEQPSNGFAARVLAAGRRAASGRLDDSLVLINHVHRQFLRDNPADDISLEGFKQRLLSEALNGALVLASADMPQVLDEEDYRASRIERGASVYALLRT